MKKPYNIFLFAAVVCASTLVSCAKDDTLNPTPEYTKVEMTIPRAASTTEQGDKIEDVTVWAYELNGSGANATIGNNGKPVGWGTKSFTNTYSSTEGETLYMELPYSAEEKTYRCFALVNKAQFGKIYTPKRNNAQSEVTSLPADVSYNDLSTYIFEANLDTDPASATTMPVSHWKDVTVPENANADTPIEFDMTVFRALGKASLEAMMDNTSSSGSQVKITGVSIGANCTNYTVPQQGFIFSDVENVSALKYPSPFGTIIDIKRGPYTETQLISSAVDVTSSATAIGSKFLYENHHDGASGIIADATAAGDGQYYMKIDYQYGTTSDFSGGTQKSATGYVALPAIVRNHEAKVEASFKVNLQGVVTLNCSVADWTQDDGEQGETDLTFNYPTYSVMAFDRGSSNEEVFNNPYVTYTDSSNKTSFTMLFQMTAPTDGTITWKPILSIKQGNETDFSIEVFEATNVDTTPAITGSNLYTSSGVSFEGGTTWYAVRVTPNNPAATTDRVTELRIVYNVPWMGTGVQESMLINGTSGTSKWPNSGDDPHYIIVTQKGTNP